MAIYFDNYAHSEYIYCGDPVGLRNLDPLTISCWINPINWGTGGYGRIVTKENMAGYGWLFFLNNVDVSAGIEFARYRSISHSQIRSVSSVISLNTWQHIAVTYSSTAMTLYINGVAASTSLNSSGSGSNMSDQYDNFIIANRGDLGRGFNGRIEGVQVYNRYLSAGEIGAIFAEQGADTIWQTQVLRLPMIQGAANTYVSTSSDEIKDLTTYTHHATSVYSTTIWDVGFIQVIG